MRDLPVVKPTRRPPGPTARARAKRRRAEDKVEKVVRAACVKRDGDCRVQTAAYGDMFAENPVVGDMLDDLREAHKCDGPSEWSHLESRARTRNMKPELRHNTATSVMLCRKHHDQLDGRARPRIRVVVLTGLGADGPLDWRTA